MATRLGLCSSLSFYRELTGSEITLGASGDCCPYADRIHWYVTLQCNQNHTDLTYLCCYRWIAPTQCIYYIFHKIYTQVLCFESVLFILCKLRTQFLWKGRQYNSASFNCYEIVGRKCLTFFLYYIMYITICVDTGLKLPGLLSSISTHPSKKSWAKVMDAVKGQHHIVRYPNDFFFFISYKTNNSCDKAIRLGS